MAQVHSEEARAALTALAGLALTGSIPEERAKEIGRAINTLDRELYETSTILARAQSMVTVQKVWASREDMAVYDCARLTKTEEALLRILLWGRGRAVNKSALMEQMYGGALDAPEPKIVDVYVCKMRRKLSGVREKLEAAGVPHEIETCWGRGYYIRPVDGADVEAA